jgi:hypothetical protein
VNNFLKSSKLISRAAGAIAPALGPYGSIASGISTGASALGYGRLKRRTKMLF